jgi:predicted acyl esterase
MAAGPAAPVSRWARSRSAAQPPSTCPIRRILCRIGIGRSSRRISWRVEVVDVAGGGSAVRRRSGGCPQLGVPAARGRHDDRRYRASFEKPAAITPNTVVEYTWSLHTQNYTFKKGHA